MALIKRVEARPASQPNVAKFKGYEYFTFPVQTVRIHVYLTPDEKEVYSVQTYRQGSKVPFGALRCEWDKCKDQSDHTIMITYNIHDNPYKLADPHRIAARLLDAIQTWIQRHR